MMIYAAAVIAAYMLGLMGVLFFLTLPWSCLVAIFGMLLAHACSFDLDTYLLIGGGMNVLLILNAGRHHRSSIKL